MESDDMGNVLYFKLLNNANNSSNRALITLESAVFTFTAEADYTPLSPASIIDGGVSAVDIPFPTSKVDYGPIVSQVYDGTTRTSYNSINVVDAKANFILYEADSYTTGTGIDGTSGYVVDYKSSGSISSLQDAFKIGTAGTTEKLYYIETPTYIELADGQHKNPVGYRIIGAQFNCKYGKNSPVTEIDTYTEYRAFTLSAVNRNTRYYLGEGDQTHSNAVKWFMDEEGYIRCGENGENYLTVVNSRLYFNVNYSTYVTTTTTKSNALRFRFSGSYLVVDSPSEYEGNYISYGSQTFADGSLNGSTKYWRLRGNSSQQPVLMFT